MNMDRAIFGRLSWFAMGVVAAITCAQLVTGTALAYDTGVYNNLLKTRDALLQQRDYLQRAYDDTAKQIDLLQQKLGRVNDYLDQNNKNLRDIDTALGQYRR